MCLTPLTLHPLPIIHILTRIRTPITPTLIPTRSHGGYTMAAITVIQGIMVLPDIMAPQDITALPDTAVMEDTAAAIAAGRRKAEGGAPNHKSKGRKAAWSRLP